MHIRDRDLRILVILAAHPPLPRKKKNDEKRSTRPPKSARTTQQMAKTQKFKSAGIRERWCELPGPGGIRRHPAGPGGTRRN